MDEQKHYIIVDNETYELYDGNGSFYVTKVSHPTDTLPLQNSLCPVKEMQSNFLSNFTVPVTMTDSNVACQTGQSLEPIIIDDYANMNYFTQAASDVTIYLNSNNGNNFMEDTNRQRGYFVDSEGVIDLTKFSTNSRSKTTSYGIPEVGSTLDLNRALHNIPHEELDAPEFIDISKLKLSYVNTKLTSEVDVLPVIKKPKTKKGFSSANTENEDSDEGDEVIFVKEFRANDKNANKPLDLRRKNANFSREKPLPQPRRNPKRQVQLLKESFDLALKLSDEEIYYGRTRKPYRDIFTETSRRSNRNTGAVLSPPVALTNKDYKEWPTEGLHERPVFNMATKKIEKFDFKAADDKRKTPQKRNDTSTAKVIKGKKLGKKGKRKAPNRSKKEKKEPPEKGISKEFASLTHETLQEVIKYVSQVKEYNDIRKGNASEISTQAETGCLIDDAKSLLKVISSSTMEENLTNAVDLLTDSCILYSLANDVCQGSVAKYLKSVQGANKV